MIPSKKKTQQEQQQQNIFTGFYLPSPSFIIPANSIQTKSKPVQSIGINVDFKRILGKIVNRKYKVTQLISVGTFSAVYKCVSLQTREKLAIKINNVKDANEFMRKENKFYRKSKQLIGFPQFYDTGDIQGRKYLVMEKLSDSLEKVFFKCQRNFTIKTILNLGIEAIKLLEKVHILGYIYRDVKPSNFLLGQKIKKDKVYLVDFGLIRTYIKSNRRHIPLRTNKPLVGTPRFASLAAHQGRQQGRKDDFYSLGYMLLYFLKGSLPWQGIKKNSDQERIKQIWRIKKTIQLEQLCRYQCEQQKIFYEGEPFIKFFRYLESLKFQDEPNYDSMKRIFRRQIERIEEMEVQSLAGKNKWKSMYYFDWLCQWDGDVQLLRDQNDNGRVSIIISGSSLPARRKATIKNSELSQQNNDAQQPSTLGEKLKSSQKPKQMKEIIKIE